MRPYRTLLSLISSLVLIIVVGTSEVHALSIKVDNIVNNAVANTTTLQFTKVSDNGNPAPPAGDAAFGTPPAGCLSGYDCYKLALWNGGSGFILNTPNTGTAWLRITTSGAGYTSGPIASVLDTPSSAAFGINGAVFQGFSAAKGQLNITLEHNFGQLTDGSRLYGFMESGGFLQPNALTGSNTCTSAPTQCGNVLSDTLTMRGTVDTTVYPATALLKTATAGTSVPYSFNLSPTTSITTTKAGGTTSKYDWVYKYDNSLGPVTSKFSDNPGGIPNCPPTAKSPHCSTIGGLGVYLTNDQTVINNMALATCGGPCPLAIATVPEPSSLLLLGSGLLSGGIFFASRLRKERDTL